MKGKTHLPTETITVKTSYWSFVKITIKNTHLSLCSSYKRAKYLIYIRFICSFFNCLSPTNHNCLNKCLLNQVCIKTKEFNFNKSDESGPEVNFSFLNISCYQVSKAEIYICCSTGEYSIVWLVIFIDSCINHLRPEFQGKRVSAKLYL